MVVEMPKMNYSMKWILPAAIVVLFLGACKEEPSLEEAFDKALLLNKWHLEGGIITEQGQTRALTIDTCKLDDFIELKAENKLAFFFGAQKCHSSEPDALFRFWHIIDGQLDLDNILYDVISVTTDSMNLRRTLVSGLGENTTIEYYYLN